MKRDYEEDVEAGLLEPRTMPTAEELRCKLNNALTEAEGLDVFGRMELAQETRRAYWPGQSPDGRKWPAEWKNTDRPFPGPWPGASDARIYLADEIVRERVLIQMAAMQRAELQIAPRNNDPQNTNKAALWRLVGAYFIEQAEADLLAAGGLLAQTVNTFGVGLVKVDWRKVYRLQERVMTAQMVIEAYVANAVERFSPTTEEELRSITEAAAQAMAGMLQDKTQKPQLANAVLLADAMCPEMEAVRVAGRLQNGAAEVPYATLKLAEDRPLVTAKIPWVHVFWHPGADKLDNSPWIAEVEWFADKGALRAEGERQGWAEEFMEEVCEGGEGHTLQSKASWALSGADVGLALSSADLPTGTQQGYQIVTLWHQCTSKAGLTAWYRTVLHPTCGGLALHEKSPHGHLSHPFVELTAEDTALLVTSRGVPEILASNQQEMKLQVDTRADRSALDTNPPWIVPALGNSGNVDIRPGVQIPKKNYSRESDIMPLTWPNNAASSVELEKSAKERADAYFVRGPLVDPDIKHLYWGDLAARFMGAWKRIVRKVWTAIQDNVASVTASRIAGVEVNLNATSADLEGEPCIEFTFDAGDLSMEKLGKKLEWIAKLLVPLDAAGSIDRDALVKMALTSLDPKLAATVYRDQGSVTQKEVDEEMEAMAQIVAGLEPSLPEGGINAALRLQVMQHAIAKSPRLQRLMGEDEQVQAVMKSRAERLQFQIQQRQNAVIGRQGGQPALDKMAEGEG